VAHEAEHGVVSLVEPPGRGVHVRDLALAVPRRLFDDRVLALAVRALQHLARPLVVPARLVRPRPPLFVELKQGHLRPLPAPWAPARGTTTRLGAREPVPCASSPPPPRA